MKPEELAPVMYAAMARAVADWGFEVPGWDDVTCANTGDLAACRDGWLAAASKAIEVLTPKGAGAALGNLAQQLRMQCHHCEWVPADDMEMALVQAHYGMEHPDAPEIKLDMKPFCTCGTPMEHAWSQPTGGGFKDYFRCPGCGSTGFVKRDG